MDLERKKKIRVVNMLATYNERENIKPMVEVLAKIADRCPGYEFITLIVDSHSPDGTSELVKEVAKNRQDLFLLETPRGLGISLINGFRYAVRNLKADIVIPNDCDFQWDPELIPEMLKKIETGYDVVVASRHVKGGEDNFGSFRKLTHFVSNTFFNYYWAGIREAKDLAGNFKAIRVRGILEKVDLDRLDVRGFVIQSTMIYELSKTGAKFIEIPAVFGARRAGESKVSFSIQFLKDVVETIKNSTRIRFERSPKLLKFVKFGIVGGVGFVINFVGLKVFNGLYRKFPWQIGIVNFFANATAAEISIISNFAWNNVWTFSKEKITSVSELLKKFIAFNVSSIIGGILVPSLIIGIGTQILGDRYRTLFLFIAVFGFTVPYNWFVYNKFIWKKKP